MTEPLNLEALDNWLAGFRKLFPGDTVPDQLVAELEATRAQRDAWAKCAEGNVGREALLLDRAERAEHRCSELTLLLADAEADRDDAMQRHAASERAARKAEAAIARVEALHHQPNTEPCSDPDCCGYDDCCDECGQPVPCDTWFALRGDQ